MHVTFVVAHYIGPSHISLSSPLLPPQLSYPDEEERAQWDKDDKQEYECKC